jgi:predicted aldo/keto reductase-like oxidoreductase
VKTALYNGVLKKTSKGIFYFDTNLGYAESEVKEFLNKPENQELFLNIKTKMQE